MEGFASALVVNPDWQACVDGVAEEIKSAPEADVGFVYVGDPLSSNTDAIVEGLRERTGIKDWIGSVGLGVSGRGVVEFDTPALSVLAGSFGETRYRVFDSTKPTDALNAWARDNDARFAVVHGDPHVTNLPDDIARFTRFFHAMLAQGVNLAPSAFETGFVSAAHGDAEIDQTLAAADHAFAQLA